MKEDLALLRKAFAIVWLRIVRFVVGIWQSARDDVLMIRNGVVLFAIVASAIVGGSLALGFAWRAFHWAAGLGG